MEKAKMARVPHPVVWLILYIPFGALSGFVSVALTYLATKNGLSITEGSLIIGSQMLISWLKWMWAPVVDITLSPKRWYVISTALSAVGVYAMSAIPLGKDSLGILLLIIALANLINSVVGMAVEVLIAALTPEDQIGRASAWFQSGNLGGTGLGGGLGLFLMQYLPQPWMSGAVMGTLFMACCFALLPLPDVKAHVTNLHPIKAVQTVMVGFWKILKERTGTLTAVLCVLPIATGAAQGTLTQATVAAFWGASDKHVALVQGVLSGLITAAGCFLGGWVCTQINARKAYAIIGILMAAIAAGMAVSPATVTMYVIWNMVYALGIGLAYAAFTAMVLSALGQSAAATGYNVYASLSNFPLWWLGLLLGWVADGHGARMMLWAEAILGIVGVAAFTYVSRFFSRKSENFAVSAS